MSELKEIGIKWEENGELHFSHVYLKDEADKVIAELRDNCKYNFEQFYDENKRLHHSNYKRCLAMAKWCRECSWSKCVEKVDFYYKWYNRWLELAEKFEEAK